MQKSTEKSEALQKNSMVFYRSFFEALQAAPPDTRLEILEAILDYGINGAVRELSSHSESFFRLVKPQIDANNKRYLNGCAEKEKRTGSKPKQMEANRSKPQAPRSKPTPNDNDNDNVNEDVFLLFWRAYPRKENRKDAVKTFTRVNGASHISSILAAISATDFSPDPKFIPLPSTWLNREPWKFDLPSLKGNSSEPAKNKGGAETPPEGWEDWFRGEYEREPEPWAEMNDHLRRAITDEMRKRKGGAV